MLRRRPFTLLVCLTIFLSTIFLNASWAVGPDGSMEELLKANQAGSTQAPVSHKAKSRHASAKSIVVPPGPYLGQPLPAAIAKVKPLVGLPNYAAAPCVLPKPRVGQWEMGAQVFFATTRGTIGWPRYSQFTWGWSGNENKADFNDDLDLPRHATWLDLSARYQFRPTWSFKYAVLFNQLSGGGQPQNYFMFGNQWGAYLGFGNNINSKWQHAYHRLSLGYDAIKSCTATVSVEAGWVHTDDRIDLGCSSCGSLTQSFSKGGDSAMVSIGLQNCIKIARNGGILSCYNKGSAIFLDDVEGWDVQLGGRYSIPLNCGRSGYVKGGYRFVGLKKQQQDLLFTSNLEGGFIEGGLIF
jgi:hypothetical protein